MKIIDVVGPSPKQWDITVRNTRNSWESRIKSDSHLVTHSVPVLGEIPVFFHLGPADKALLVRLAVAGGDHGKFARSLPINMELEVTGSVLRQLYTYRAGVGFQGGEPIEPTDIMINSTSVMHTAGRRPIEVDDIDVVGFKPGVAERLVDLMNEQREFWIDQGKRKPSDEWRGLVNLIPSGWVYTIHFSCNYSVARSMYQSRKNHRLRDDWGTLCASFASLEYSEIITTKRGESNE